MVNCITEILVKDGTIKKKKEKRNVDRKSWFIFVREDVANGSNINLEKNFLSFNRQRCITV